MGGGVGNGIGLQLERGRHHHVGLGHHKALVVRHSEAGLRVFDFGAEGIQLIALVGADDGHDIGAHRGAGGAGHGAVLAGGVAEAVHAVHHRRLHAVGAVGQRDPGAVEAVLGEGRTPEISPCIAGLGLGIFHRALHLRHVERVAGLRRQQGGAVVAGGGADGQRSGVFGQGAALLPADSRDHGAVGGVGKVMDMGGGEIERGLGGKVFLTSADVIYTAGVISLHAGALPGNAVPGDTGVVALLHLLHGHQQVALSIDIVGAEGDVHGLAGTIQFSRVNQRLGCHVLECADGVARIGAHIHIEGAGPCLFGRVGGVEAQLLQGVAFGGRQVVSGDDILAVQIAICIISVNGNITVAVRPLIDGHHQLGIQHRNRTGSLEGGVVRVGKGHRGAARVAALDVHRGAGGNRLIQRGGACLVAIQGHDALLAGWHTPGHGFLRRVVGFHGDLQRGALAAHDGHVFLGQLYRALRRRRKGSHNELLLGVRRHVGHAVETVIAGFHRAALRYGERAGNGLGIILCKHTAGSAQSTLVDGCVTGDAMVVATGFHSGVVQHDAARDAKGVFVIGGDGLSAQGSDLAAVAERNLRPVALGANTEARPLGQVAANGGKAAGAGEGQGAVAVNAAVVRRRRRSSDPVFAPEDDGQRLETAIEDSRSVIIAAASLQHAAARHQRGAAVPLAGVTGAVIGEAVEGESIGVRVVGRLAAFIERGIVVRGDCGLPHPQVVQSGDLDGRIVQQLRLFRRGEYGLGLLIGFVIHHRAEAGEGTLHRAADRLGIAPGLHHAAGLGQGAGDGIACAVGHCLQLAAGHNHVAVNDVVVVTSVSLYGAAVHSDSASDQAVTIGIRLHSAAVHGEIAENSGHTAAVTGVIVHHFQVTAVDDNVAANGRLYLVIRAAIVSDNYATTVHSEAAVDAVDAAVVTAVNAQPCAVDSEAAAGAQHHGGALPLAIDLQASVAFRLPIDGQAGTVRDLDIGVIAVLIVPTQQVVVVADNQLHVAADGKRCHQLGVAVHHIPPVRTSRQIVGHDGVGVNGLLGIRHRMGDGVHRHVLVRHRVIRLDRQGDGGQQPHNHRQAQQPAQCLFHSLHALPPSNRFRSTNLQSKYTMNTAAGQQKTWCFSPFCQIAQME